MGYTIAALACGIMSAWVMYNANSYDWHHNTAWMCVSLLLLAFGFAFYFMS